MNKIQQFIYENGHEVNGYQLLNREQTKLNNRGYVCVDLQNSYDYVTIICGRTYVFNSPLNSDDKSSELLDIIESEEVI